MIKYFKENLPLGVLTFFIFSIALNEIATVFDVQNSQAIVLFVGSLTVVACVIPYIVVRFLLYVLIYIFSLYSLSFSGYFYSSSFFITDWLSHLQAFITKQHTEHYSLIVMSIILLVIALMIEWQILSETITPQMVFLVGYLLFLNEFNDLSVTIPIVLMVCLYLLERVVVNSEIKINMLFVLNIVIVLFIGLVSFYGQSSTIKSSLISVSTPLRQRVDEIGLYQFINDNKLRFMATTGFGEDDRLLGGPVKDDESLVFDVKQKKSRYWRVDSKAEYTGKGWVNSDSGIPKFQSVESLLIEPSGYKNDYMPPEKITMHFYDNENYLPISYGKIDLSKNNDHTTYQYNDVSGRVNMSKKSDSEDISMTIYSPTYTEESLKKAELVIPDDQYLQLPYDLPKNIEELTKEITQDKDTLYDKVKAVETHLKTSSEYTYSKSGTRHVPDNSDYVSFFLFESKVGYCNNFSSAMSVMLRTIGIPTRWVKGFNQGEVRESDGDDKVYNIRNSNAHSWVEVYFEGSGWVPFEPTPRFNGAQIVETQTEEIKTTPSSRQEETKESTTQTNGSTTQSTENKQEKQVSLWAQIKRLIQDNKRMTKLISRLVGLILIISVIVFCLTYRYYIMLWVSLNILKQPFTKVYSILLKQAESLLPRDVSMTLTVYTEDIGQKYPHIETVFSQFTQLYERIVYGSKEDERLTTQEVQSMLKLSQTLIKLKRTSS